MPKALSLVYLLAVLTIAPFTTARADFFDGTRNFFQNDFPHFFQDDVPCAFGGNPTSGAKTWCKESEQQHAANKDDTNKLPPPPPRKPKPQ